MPSWAAQPGGVSTEGVVPSYSIDNPLNQPKDYTQYTPYNDGMTRLDLSWLELKRFIRSRGVVSPDKGKMAYSEVSFIPKFRQTFSKIFVTPIAPPPKDPVSPLPEDQYANPERKAYMSQPDVNFFSTRLDPNKSFHQRQELHKVGQYRFNDYDFKTLTVVDWSATGSRLLMRQRSGILYHGERTSDILVYDEPQGTVTIYPEIKRAIEHYWLTHSAAPPLKEQVWDIYPLGWATGSDSTVLVTAWVYEGDSQNSHKHFLGTWSYDVVAEQTRLVSLNQPGGPFRSNGQVAEVELGR